jgi:integrase
MFNLASMYEEGISCVRDYSKAFEWFLRAAQEGDGQAAYIVAQYYRQGLGVRQSKTGADTWLAMPTGVGNAIYRYLKDARPRDTKSDSVFVSTRTPYGGITRSVCYSTLRRVLPERDVPGSGFHVTRKSFSTNRLRSGVSPSGIADALGHSGTDNLRPYLSLDVRNMSKCPLSLVYLGIPVEGGRR